MDKAIKYRRLRRNLESGHVPNVNAMFDDVDLSTMRSDLHMSYGAIVKAQQDPGEFKLRHIIILSKMTGYDMSKLASKVLFEALSVFEANQKKTAKKATEKRRKKTSRKRPD